MSLQVAAQSLTQQRVKAPSLNFEKLTCPQCRKASPAAEFFEAKASTSSVLQELQEKLKHLERVREDLMAQLEAEARRVDSPSVGRSGFGSFAPQKHSYKVTELDEAGRRALQLLTTHDQVMFKVNGLCLTQQSEKNEAAADRITRFRRQFPKQDFMCGVRGTSRLFMAYSKSASSRGNKDQTSKQYRQSRSFSTLAGAVFEQAKDNMLRIWFSNSSGFFLVSFASEAEARMILNICNIIIHNEDYHEPLDSQVMWSGYAQKKGKHMGKKMRYIVLADHYVEMYRSHNNYQNGEKPSQKFSLMACDFSQRRSQGKEVAFRRKSEDSAFITIAFFTEVERDDFLSICAKTLGDAIAKQTQANGRLVPSKAVQEEVELSMSNRAEVDDEKEFSMSLSDEKFDDGVVSVPDVSPVGSGDIHTRTTPGRPQTPTALQAHDWETPGLEEEKLGSPTGRGALMRRMQSVKTLAGPQTFFHHAKALQLVSDQLVEKRSERHRRYMEQLSNTPRMYGASHMKAVQRLVRKRASDVDFIEEKFTGDETKLLAEQDEFLQTYRLLEVIGHSIGSGAFLNRKLFIHKAVWTQNKVMLLNYEMKVEIFGTILGGLDKAFGDVDIVWLQKDNFRNCDKFHTRLIECEETLSTAQTRLIEFANKEVSKAKKTGVGKWVSNLRDRSQGKVNDNSEYRQLVQQICSHSSKMEMYYKYLSSGEIHATQSHILMNDLQNITKSLVAFTQVVFSDVKEFVKAYLRRGAKNLYT